MAKKGFRFAARAKHRKPYCRQSSPVSGFVPSITDAVSCQIVSPPDLELHKTLPIPALRRISSVPTPQTDGSTNSCTVETELVHTIAQLSLANSQLASANTDLTQSNALLVAQIIELSRNKSTMGSANVQASSAKVQKAMASPIPKALNADAILPTGMDVSEKVYNAGAVDQTPDTSQGLLQPLAPESDGVLAPPFSLVDESNPLSPAVVPTLQRSILRWGQSKDLGWARKTRSAKEVTQYIIGQIRSSLAFGAISRDGRYLRTLIERFQRECSSKIRRNKVHNIKSSKRSIESRGSPAL